MSHVTSSPPATGPGLKKTLSSLDAYAMAVSYTHLTLPTKA